jgi:YD repeat-containing protein
VKNFQAPPTTPESDGTVTEFTAVRSFGEAIFRATGGAPANLVALYTAHGHRHRLDYDAVWKSVAERYPVILKRLAE